MDFKTICEIIAVIAILVIVAGIVLIGLWYAITSSYFYFQLKKCSNILQWKCIELDDSKEKRLNGEIDYYTCRLCYRILPSSLNKFTRIFSDNYWHYPFYSDFKFKSKEDFKKYVSQFKTYKDIKVWIDNENGVLWYEP